MNKSNMNFAVDGTAVAYNMLDGEIRARMVTRNNPERKALYKEKGIIDSSPAITRFMVKYPNVFGNKKLIHADGSNFFGGILSLSPLAGTNSQKEMLKNRMKYEYDLSDEELQGLEVFFEDLNHLKDTPEIQEIVDKTISYKNYIKSAWETNEAQVMKHIKTILGYEPEVVGNVNTYVMYPSFDTHRSCQLTDKKIYMYFGKCQKAIGKKADKIYEAKLVSSLAHQAVHQPMLPYKTAMTKSEKETFHAFIKYLTDKDIYSSISGRSYLDIVTPNENHELMAKMYPFWLGYRYRNADKEGLNSVIEVKKAITRDKEYFDGLPENSKRKKAFSAYNFEKLDAEKIAKLFRDRRAITPYEFAKLSIDDRSLVYKGRYVSEEVR
jgi:hypothetical protein